MAITRSDIPDLITAGLKTEFELAMRLELDASPARNLATIINTTQPIQNYGWLSATPNMREFIDERQPTSLTQSKISVEDKVFEATLAIERKAIEDDQFDMIRLRVKDLANQVGLHQHQLIIETLTSGLFTPGFDGNTFFGSRTVAGQSFDNSIEEPLSQDALQLGVSRLMSITDDYGTPLGIQPDTLVVGPSLMWTALELIESPVVVIKYSGDNSTPYSNPMQGKLKVVVSPFLRGISESNWFLLDTSRTMKAVILQQRSDVPVEFTALDQASGAEAAFMRDRYYYGVRGRYNTGLGMWQSALVGGAA